MTVRKGRDGEARGELENVRWGVASRQAETPWWIGSRNGCGSGEEQLAPMSSNAHGTTALDWTEVQCA